MAVSGLRSSELLFMFTKIWNVWAIMSQTIHSAIRWTKPPKAVIPRKLLTCQLILNIKRWKKSISEQLIQEMRIRNYSERTIYTYSSLLRNFFRYCRKSSQEASTADLKNYIYYRLKTDDISVSTINQTISAWKIVYVHLLN